MNQSDQALVKKVSPHSSYIMRFFLLLITLLLVSIGVMVQSAVNSWLKDKSSQIISTADAINKRVETYRYATWQLYNEVTVSPSPADPQLQETRLRQDVYYLEKPRLKTETLIFGAHENSTLGMAKQISTYLDTLWGAESSPWSMYYLNGLDNSTILVSTMPLTDLSSNFRDVGVANIVDARRAEMLQQANTLDERESFSMLRKLNWQNLYYFTVRTTFNMPGHLPTLVAFDLPINDLVPAQLPIASFRLESEQRNYKLDNDDKNVIPRVNIGFHQGKIEISAPIATTPLNLVWQVPYGLLTLDALQNILLPLILNFGLLALAFYGLNTFRRRANEQAKSPDPEHEIQSFQALNEEIINQIPIGLLAFDQDAGRTIVANPIADRLLPHLNLHKIMSMTDQRQGVIQATVNNEFYEIYQVRSQALPHVQIFVIQDQDREILVDTKMKQVQRLFEKNQYARRDFMKNISAVLQQPAKDIFALSEGLPDTLRSDFTDAALTLLQRVDEIRLLNDLESGSWQSHQTEFSLTELTDELALMLLPSINRKGLHFLINNHLPLSTLSLGDRAALSTILRLLLQYSVTTTRIGRITLEIEADATRDNQLIFRLLDTSAGLSPGEVENSFFPFSNETSHDRYQQANGMAFYLCECLAKKLDGSLNIKTTEDIGTRYELKLPMRLVEDVPEEKLLDDVNVVLEITSSKIREVAVRWLENLGARCIIGNDKLAGQDYDLFMTDNPSILTVPGLLLSDDEVGIHSLGNNQYRVNININHAMQEAVLQLIENLLSGEHESTSTSITDTLNQLQKSGYFPLFVETVPEDISRLHTEYDAHDIDALSQTAHRLKGVFAMLNLNDGKYLCEVLEKEIQNNGAEIQKYINDIDTYVKCLLQQGSLLNE